MSLGKRLTARFLTLLLSTPEGRAHVLSQAADAEANGEGGVFDRLLARVEEPEIARLVARHQADEVRHAALFRERLAVTGVTPAPVPAELRLIDRLDLALDRGMDVPMSTRREVMEAYLLLQVIEERAVTQFGVMEPVFRAVDPATADVLLAIGRDEERHLKYCRAIARRYAPDTATLEATLRGYRELEARVYAEHSHANMKYVFARGIVRAGAVESLLWRGVGAAMALGGKGQRTPFWADETPGGAALELAAAA